MGGETSILSPPKLTSLGHVRAVKQLRTEALHTGEEESVFNWILPGYFM